MDLTKLKHLLNSNLNSKINTKLIINLILVVGFLFVNSFLISQELKWERDVNIVAADKLLDESKFAQADSIYKEALYLNEQKSDWKNCYLAIRGICKVAIAQESFEALIDSYKTYIKIIPEDNFKYNGAVCNYLGYTFNMLNQIYPSMECYELAVVSKTETLDTTDVKSVRTFMKLLANLSLAYSQLGDNQSALETVEKSLVFKDFISTQKYCNTLIEKGKYLFHNDQNELAKEQYWLAIENCDDPFIPLIYLVEVYLQQDSLHEAKSALTKSEKYFDAQIYKTEYNVASAQYYKKSGDLEQAKAFLSPLFIDGYEFDNSRIEVREIVNYARVLYELESYDQSLKFIDKALGMHFEIDTATEKSRPINDNSLPDVWIIEALLIKADYFFMNYINSSNIRDLEESEFYFDLVFSYFDELKSKFQSTSSKYKMGSYTQNIYNKLIEFNIGQFSVTRDEKYFLKAFNLIQRSSAFVLKNSISERKAFEILGVEKDTVQKYLYYKDRLSGDKKIDNEMLNSTEFVSFIDFEKRLFNAYPSLRDYYKNEVVDINEVQKSIGDKSLVLQYYYFDNQLYSFQISKTSIDILNHPIDENFETKIDNYANLITNHSQQSLSDFSSESYALFAILLGSILDNPLYSNVDQLVLIPDGPIKQVAFNSLINRPDVRFPIVDDYLINKYEISYLYYASQLINIDSKDKNENGFVGFGIEYNDTALQQIIRDYQSQVRSSRTVNPVSLTALKYAAKEVLEIANFIGGDAYVNENVTYGNLVKAINDYQIVHISAHAFLNENKYTDSYIALTQNPEEKYKLTYSDILNLNLNNDFVVLSACQTNSGKQIAGEGMMSLSRAFTQSGSKSVMGAYWDSSDKITKDIMKLFYENLNEGYTKSKSLQLAQLEFLSNDEISTPTFRHPFYWSAWAIYGGNESLTFDNYRYGFYLGLSCLILIVGFCIWVFLKRRIH